MYLDFTRRTQRNDPRRHPRSREIARLICNPCLSFYFIRGLTGIAHPAMGKHFQVLEVHRGMKYIQDLSCEEGLDYGLFSGFVTF